MENTNTTQTSSGSLMQKVEKTLDLYFGQKAPKMSDAIAQAIVQYGPWLILLSIIISIPGYITLLSVFGMSASILPKFMQYAPVSGYMYGLGYGYAIVSLLFGVAITILNALAIPHLLKKAKTGWNYIYYGSLLMVVENILLMNIFGLLIGGAISFYILFQIKRYYS